MKKLIFALLILTPCVAWGANKTCYINTDNVSGNYDGTTEARGYRTQSEMEDAEDGVAYSAGETLTVYITGATADTTAVTYAGWDTDVTIDLIGNFVGTKYDSSKYHMAVAGTAITLNSAGINICIHNIQIVQAGYNGIVTGVNEFTARIYNNLLISTSAAEDISGIGIEHEGTYYVYNNIIIGFCSAGTASWGLSSATNGGGNNVYAYNNTIDRAGIGAWGAGIGARNPYTTLIAVNNIVIGYGSKWNNYGGTFAEGTDYNATDHSSLGYTVTGSGNTHDHVSHTFTFVDGTNATLTSRDYALASNDEGAKDLGTSLSGTFTTDILGNTRSGTWDLGAHEQGAGSPAAFPQILIFQ